MALDPIADLTGPSVEEGDGKTWFTNMRAYLAGLLGTDGVPATARAALGILVKRKTADESVTSSTTLQDDDHLNFPIAANEEWCADFSLFAGTSLNATGIKVAITTPAGATLDVVSAIVGSSGQNSTATTQTSGAALVHSASDLSSTAQGIVRVSAWILNGANAGSVTLQFAQNTSSGTALTLRKGSHLSAKRVVP